MTKADNPLPTRRGLVGALTPGAVATGAIAPRFALARSGFKKSFD